MNENNRQPPTLEAIEVFYNDLSEVITKHTDEKETLYALTLLHGTIAIVVANIIENINDATTDGLTKETIKEQLFRDIEKRLGQKETH